MNCPRCNAPSVEGKNYCADCGTPLDAQTKQLETLVKAQVDEIIRERFKDQNVVEVETSQAIVERLSGWAKLFAFFVGVPIGLCLIWLSIAGFEKLSDFKNLIARVEGQVIPKIEQAKADSEQAQKIAADAKTKAEGAEKTIEDVTTQVKKQLGSATEITKSVHALSERVSDLEKQTSTQMKDSSRRIDERVAELDRKIDAAFKDISEQQRKLTRTDELVKAMYSSRTTEYFETQSNASNVVIAALKNGAFVFMLLKSVPIPESVEVKWRVYSQPRGAYRVVKGNVLLFIWGESPDNLKQYPLEISYVPDPTPTLPSFKSLSIKNGALYGDDTKLTDLPPAQ
ncbi:MAG: hypothetical protein ABSE79_04795 [Terriglobia bacterium]|jgi:hypothetical protein